MPLDGFPGTTRGDPHLFVVVTGGAAGRERVVEPKIPRLGEAVGNIRESRSSLVGCNDQVRILIIMANDALRMNDVVGTDVVGQIEQRANEELIGRHALGLYGGAIERACA